MSDPRDDRSLSIKGKITRTRKAYKFLEMPTCYSCMGVDMCPYEGMRIRSCWSWCTRLDDGHALWCMVSTGEEKCDLCRSMGGDWYAPGWSEWDETRSVASSDIPSAFSQ